MEESGAITWEVATPGVHVAREPIETFAWSPDGSQLALVRADDHGAVVVLDVMSSHTFPLLVVGTARAVAWLGPDQLAVLRDLGASGARLDVHALPDGGVVESVELAGNGHARVTCTADGGSVLVAPWWQAGRTSTAPACLLTRPLAATTIVTLDPDTLPDGPPGPRARPVRACLHPDGRTVAFVFGRRAGAGPRSRWDELQCVVVVDLAAKQTTTHRGAELTMDGHPSAEWVGPRQFVSVDGWVARINTEARTSTALLRDTDREVRMEYRALHACAGRRALVTGTFGRAFVDWFDALAELDLATGGYTTVLTWNRAPVDVKRLVGFDACRFEPEGDALPQASVVIRATRATHGETPALRVAVGDDGGPGVLGATWLGEDVAVLRGAETGHRCVEFWPRTSGAPRATIALPEHPRDAQTGDGERIRRAGLRWSRPPARDPEEDRPVALGGSPDGAWLIVLDDMRDGMRLILIRSVR